MGLWYESVLFLFFHFWDRFWDSKLTSDPPWMGRLMSKMIWICFCSSFHLEVEFWSLGWAKEFFWTVDCSKHECQVSNLGFRLPMPVFALWAAPPEPWKPPQAAGGGAETLGTGASIPPLPIASTSQRQCSLAEPQVTTCSRGCLAETRRSHSGAWAKLPTQSCELR